MTDPASQHVSTFIAVPADVVYAFASDPRELSRWAAGLADPALSAVDVVFAPPNAFGVLDHVVTLPSGESVYNPMRVIPDGDARCEVVFTLRRREGVSDDDFDADARAVAADLETLRALLED